MTLGDLLAYVGPGPGLTMLWALIALLGTIGLAVLYLLAWPLRMLIRRKRGVAPTEDPPAAAPDANPAEPTEPTDTPVKRQ